MLDYNYAVYEDDLTNLEEGLRRLKVEFDVFFNGHSKKAPEDLKFRVERLVKRLSEVQNMSFSERFRYNTLITRYYVYRDLWRRTMMLRESSDYYRDEAPAAKPVAAACRVRVSIADSEVEDEKVRELYDALVSMKGKPLAESPALYYPHFASYIARKTQSIRREFGCARVLFTISKEEDAIRFTATAEKSE